MKKKVNNREHDKEVLAMLQKLLRAIGCQCSVVVELAPEVGRAVVTYGTELVNPQVSVDLLGFAEWVKDLVKVNKMTGDAAQAAILRVLRRKAEMAQMQMTNEREETP